MVGNASGVDLNSATVNRIARIGGIGPDLAARLVERRPIRSWVDLEKIPGFDHEMVNDLRGSGAKIGRTAPATVTKKTYNRTLRRAEPERSAARSGRNSEEAQLPRNIFSGRGRE